MSIRQKRLEKIENWPELAKQSGFKARVLARDLNISSWTLQRHTKKFFGQSPQKWLNEQRMTLAAEMLKDCDSIKWLAVELGYKNESHFSHQFRRRYNLSPLEFLSHSPSPMVISGQCSTPTSIKAEISKMQSHL